MTRIRGTSFEDKCALLVVSRSVLLRMREVSNEICRENRKHILYLQYFLFLENRSIYERMWKNIWQPDRPQMTILRTRISCWTPKATNAHSECVTLIPFPLQERLHESSSLLRSCTLSVLFKSEKHRIWGKLDKGSDVRLNVTLRLVREICRGHFCG
jgi:hypothetical protein